MCPAVQRLDSPCGPAGTPCAGSAPDLAGRGMAAGVRPGPGGANFSRGGAVAARLAHNQEVGGSNPPPATMYRRRGRARVAKVKAPPAVTPPPATSEPKPPRRPFGAGMGAKPLVMKQEARAKRLAAIKEAGRRIAERDPNLDPPQQHGRTLATGSEPVTFGSN